MISYPCVTCDRKKLLHNLNTLAEQMHKDNHIFAAVIKGFSADDDIIHIIEESDCDWIADSRIEDLLKLSTKKNRFLIRLSQLSEIPNVILGSDVSFESEVTTIQALQEEAKRQNVTHGIILAIDMGDLREGCFFQNLADIDAAVMSVQRSPNLKLMGIGTNLGCFGGVITDRNNMEGLVAVADYIETKFHCKLEYISGMTSAAYGMVKDGSMPERINHGRFGELWLLGFESVSGVRYPEYYDDAFLFHAQIIEIKEKPSKPIGRIGGNAFGVYVERPDDGNMLRGLLAFGAQDVEYEHLVPVDPGLTVLGSSSDHTIVKLDPSKHYQVGDVLQFKLKYHSLLRLYTSKYVKKYII